MKCKYCKYYNPLPNKKYGRCSDGDDDIYSVSENDSCRAFEYINKPKHK